MLNYSSENIHIFKPHHGEVSQCLCSLTQPLFTGCFLLVGRQLCTSCTESFSNLGRHCKPFCHASCLVGKGAESTQVSPATKSAHASWAFADESACSVDILEAFLDHLSAHFWGFAESVMVDKVE